MCSILSSVRYFSLVILVFIPKAKSELGSSVITGEKKHIKKVSLVLLVLLKTRILTCPSRWTLDFRKALGLEGIMGWTDRVVNIAVTINTPFGNTYFNKIGLM